MKVQMKVEGGAELASALNSLSMKISKRVKLEALKAGAEPIRSEMEKLAPRAPGAPDLADHIGISQAKVEGLIDNEQTAAVAVGPTRDFYYGLFQEMGTAFHGAQPFARPAFDGHTDSALTIIIDELWWALRSTLRGQP
jgi:HK97 gp10 family phage protein